MNQENINLCVDSETTQSLDAIASGIDRDRSYVINEAITVYLEMHKWQLQEFKKSITEVETRDFVGLEEVPTAFVGFENLN